MNRTTGRYYKNIYGGEAESHSTWRELNNSVQWPCWRIYFEKRGKQLQSLRVFKVNNPLFSSLHCIKHFLNGQMIKKVLFYMYLQPFLNNSKIAHSYINKHATYKSNICVWEGWYLDRILIFRDNIHLFFCIPRFLMLKYVDYKISPKIFSLLSMNYWTRLLSIFLDWLALKGRELYLYCYLIRSCTEYICIRAFSKGLVRKRKVTS